MGTDMIRDSRDVWPDDVPVGTFDINRVRLKAIRRALIFCLSVQTTNAVVFC